MAQEPSGVQWSNQEIGIGRGHRSLFGLIPSPVVFNAPMAETCHNAHSRGRHTPHCVAPWPYGVRCPACSPPARYPRPGEVPLLTAIGAVLDSRPTNCPDESRWSGVTSERRSRRCLAPGARRVTFQVVAQMLVRDASRDR